MLRTSEIAKPGAPPVSFERALLDHIAHTMRPRETLNLWCARTLIAIGQIARPIRREVPGRPFATRVVGVEFLMTKEEVARRAKLADERNAADKTIPRGALDVPPETPRGPRIWTI